MEDYETTKVLVISIVGLLFTAGIQWLVAALSGSVALFANSIHAFADALTSIPLWLAFWLSRRPKTKKFPYGLNRSEDIAGLFILLIISLSILIVMYESITRMFHATEPNNLWAVSVAAIVGFIGNEAVALFRIRMGVKIGSAALIADGKHAQIDGLTSLSVLLGIIGIGLGYPIVDPLVGFAISIMMLFTLKNSASLVFTRLLDGIDPAIIDQIKTSCLLVDKIHEVTDIRARWLGHEIQTQLSIAVDGQLSVTDGHNIAKTVIRRLHHDIPHLTSVEVHIDPVEERGSIYHMDDIRKTM